MVIIMEEPVVENTEQKIHRESNIVISTYNSWYLQLVVTQIGGALTLIVTLYLLLLFHSGT